MDRIRARAGEDHLAALEVDRPRAQRLDAVHLVRDQQHRLAAGEKALHVLDALPAEGEVADREDLVDQQGVRVEMGGHGIAEARPHAGAVGEDRRVDELLELRELDDLPEQTARLVARRGRAGRRCGRCSRDLRGWG